MFYFRTRTTVQASCEKNSMEWRLRPVVPAATVTTRAKPYVQQQLARDLEVESAAMGQRCRSHKVLARCSDAIRCISCELQLCCCVADVRGGTVVGALLPISLSGNLRMVWVLIPQ